MNSDPDIFSQKLNLPYSALSISGRVKMDWLLNLFQDTASTQCHALGISGFHMAKKNLKWVVAQSRIQIHKSFDWMTPLAVQTWRAPWKNLYEVRQFRLVAQEALGSKNPSVLVTASSIWILVKACNNRPVRLAPNLPQALMACTPKNPEKRIIPDEELARVDHECTFPVRFLDLDLNEHVNNGIYLRWAVDTLPGALNFEYTPMACDVIYQSQALPEDTVQSRISMNFEEDLLFTDHVIVRAASNEKLARLMLTWKKAGTQSLFHTKATG